MERNKMHIGVMALQGAFIEHSRIIHNLGSQVKEVRLPEDLKELEGLIIPGGESTTILKLMHEENIFQPLKTMIINGFPVWGTCAGMICLAQKVSNSQESMLQPLEVMDIEVKRNAFGRQIDSFEVDLSIPIIGEKPYPAVFIRAPLIEKVGRSVKILASLSDGTVVAAVQANILVSSFHPELTNDFRFHEYFLNLAAKSITKYLCSLSK
jgi:pyridoxal 5'-phosphate synthase pdxT subunit